MFGIVVCSPLLEQFGRSCAIGSVSHARLNHDSKEPLLLIKLCDHREVGGAGSTVELAVKGQTGLTGCVRPLRVFAAAAGARSSSSPYVPYP